MGKGCAKLINFPTLMGSDTHTRVKGKGERGKGLGIFVPNVTTGVTLFYRAW